MLLPLGMAELAAATGRGPAAEPAEPAGAAGAGAAAGMPAGAGAMPAAGMSPAPGAGAAAAAGAAAPPSGAAASGMGMGAGAAGAGTASGASAGAANAGASANSTCLTLLELLGSTPEFSFERALLEGVNITVRAARGCSCGGLQRAASSEGRLGAVSCSGLCGLAEARASRRPRPTLRA